jgi:hypothetical protein
VVAHTTFPFGSPLFWPGPMENSHMASSIAVPLRPASRCRWCWVCRTQWFHSEWVQLSSGLSNQNARWPGPLSRLRFMVSLAISARIGPSRPRLLTEFPRSPEHSFKQLLAWAEPSSPSVAEQTPVARISTWASAAKPQASPFSLLHFFTLQRAIRLTENLQLKTDNFSHPANLAAKNNTNIPTIIR